MVHAVTDVTGRNCTHLDTHALRDLDSKTTSQSHLYSRIFHLKGVLALERKENEAVDLVQPYPFTEAQREVECFTQSHTDSTSNGTKFQPKFPGLLNTVQHRSPFTLEVNSLYSHDLI